MATSPLASRSRRHRWLRRRPYRKPLTVQFHHGCVGADGGPHDLLPLGLDPRPPDPLLQFPVHNQDQERAEQVPPIISSRQRYTGRIRSRVFFCRKQHSNCHGCMYFKAAYVAVSGAFTH